MKVRILCNVQLQELRNYLIAQQLKFLVLKGESNNEELSRIEMIDLIKATGMFLFAQHGSNSNPLERKAIVESLHELFPRLACDTISKKLGQWVTNKQRPPTAKKACIRELHSKPSGETLDYEDYEELLEIHNVSTQRGDAHASIGGFKCTQTFEEYDVGD